METAFFEPEVELMPRERIDALHEERILELVPYVYERSGLIRETWDRARVHPRDIRSLADFKARAPFTTKDEIRSFRDRHGDPFGGLLCVDPLDLTTVTSTSGTTGDATLLPEQWGPWSKQSLDAARFWWGAGVRPGHHGFAPWAYRSPGYYEGLQMCGAVPILFEPSEVDWKRVIERVQRYEATFLFLGSRDVVALNRLAEEVDLRRACASLEVVKYGGAPIGAHMHRRMVDEWGMNVFMLTTAGDAGLSFECPEHTGCHIWEDNVLPEHLDPESGADAPDGTVGELVVTAIDDRVAPLVRYRSDDLVRFSRARCNCGRWHARQWPVARKGEEVIVEGRTIVPLDIWAALETVPATRDGIFQLIRPRREMDELRVRVGYDPAQARRPETLETVVSTAIAEQVHVEPRLELLPTDEVLARCPGYKIIRVVKA